MTTKTVLIEVEVPENWPADRIVGVDPCVLAVKHLGAFPSRPVPPARAVPDVDDMAQFIRQIDGSHSMGAGALAENICEWLSSTPAEPARAAGDAVSVPKDVLNEALLLISTLTDPKAKTPGRTDAARALLPKLRTIMATELADGWR